MAVDRDRQRAGAALGARHRLDHRQHGRVLIVATGMIPVDQVVTARGIVVSQSPTILVQPLDTAIVRSIDVREGQQVRAGKVLARLDPTFAAADLATLEAQVPTSRPRWRACRRRPQGKPFDYTGTDPNWLLQAAIYAHRKAEFEAKVENYRHRLDELAAVITRSHSDAAGYSERLGVARTSRTCASSSRRGKWAAELNTLVATDNRAEMARSLANAQQTSEGASRDQEALESERDGYVRGWQAEPRKNCPTRPAR